MVYAVLSCCNLTQLLKTVSSLTHPWGSMNEHFVLEGCFCVYFRFAYSYVCLKSKVTGVNPVLSMETGRQSE